MDTIVILFFYFLTTLALPMFMWRRHRHAFSVLRPVAILVLGALPLIVPFIELCKPGQPAACSEFPYIRNRDRRRRRRSPASRCTRGPSSGSGDTGDTLRTGRRVDLKVKRAGCQGRWRPAADPVPATPRSRRYRHRLPSRSATNRELLKNELRPAATDHGPSAETPLRSGAETYVWRGIYGCFRSRR